MEQQSPDTYWKKCSSCKKPIGFSTKYFICSVSTCNGERTGYVFCSIPCFERHLPGARHRDAGAVEKMSPSTSATAAATGSAGETSAQAARTLVRPSGGGSLSTQKQLPKEVLIIASRLKEYIQAKSEFNTSANVMDVLSDHVRILCDRAIDNARAEGRKTVLDRDFEFLKRS